MDRSFEEARKRELQAIIDNMRYECSDLVDKYYLAWRYAGRSSIEWERVSAFEHEWFQSFNREKLTFEERRGALKVIRAYLRSQIETLELEAMIKREGRKNVFRHTATTRKDEGQPKE